jgi:hypothetical protein
MILLSPACMIKAEPADDIAPGLGSEEEENDPDLRPPEAVNDPYSFHKQPPDDADADYRADER